MEPGLYRISIQHPGCKGFVEDRVEVTINSTVRVDATLEVGQVTETVEVVATALQIRTDRADLSQQIQPNQVGTCRSRRTAITRACRRWCRGPRNPPRSASRSATRAASWPPTSTARTIAATDYDLLLLMELTPQATAASVRPTLIALAKVSAARLR